MPTLIQTSGVIDADSSFESRLRDSLLQIAMDRHRSLVRARPASRAYKDVNCEGSHLHFHRPITLELPLMVKSRPQHFELAMNHQQ
jgi:hypothetical protein